MAKLGKLPLGVNEYELWMGDSASFATYKAVMSQSLAVKEAVQLRTSMSADDDSSYLIQRSGDLAIVSVHGPLLNVDNDYTRWMKMATYPEIRNAMIELAMDDRIKKVLLDIKSGGGAASGVDTGSGAISELRKRKPVIAFAHNLMASAAYWLGSAADQIYASRLSQIGSIGAMTVHMTFARALKEFGVDVEVFRSAELKAIGSPMEELSDKARAEIQLGIDTWHAEFVNHVASERGVAPARVQSDWATGQVFFAPKALQLGLIDGIMTFDGLVSAMLNQSFSSPSR